jgi:hypothetical protein
VSFEKATPSKSESNIDGDFFSRSLQIWKNVLPTNMNAQTGEMEYVANDPDMVGFQFVAISDNNRLVLNKYTRFVTSVGEQRTCDKTRGSWGSRIDAYTQPVLRQRSLFAYIRNL